MQLTEYLQKEAGLSAETATLLENLFDSKEYPKGHIFLKEGSYSKNLFYIEKGIVRAYYWKDDKDITQDFFTETSIIASIESIFLNQPFPYYYETLEKASIRTVDFSKVEMLMEENVKLQRFALYITTSVIKKLALRLQFLQFQTAQERYKLLLEKHPDILLRASLGHIASYLGVTQSTLSVFRAENSK